MLPAKIMRMRNPSASSGGDPHWANVVALLHFDGADASTSIVDEAGGSWSAVGNAQLDTAQAKFGASSLLLDGSGDRAIGTAGNNFLLDGDFTIEGWCRYNSAASNNNRRFFDLKPTGTGNSLFIYRSSLSQVTVNVGGTTAGGSMSNDVFVHLAVARVGSSVRFFIDGTQAGSTITNSATLGNNTVAPVIGSDLAGRDWNGWIDEVRITKGVGRYTSSFTPPTAAFPNS
ncbi:hypothetical protein C3942_00895 [Solimonas fluminis]|uniref:LamG-like jellyroll fold domain-containing protein n=1 Tax=Solimonas fluminis TaxID=2086571 RepID=A0A2S5TKL9_9GAMM|nr:LamG domain-containing protein [Solimonas fluminis]PPE75482.1 hypothetical protein C3942_00895 [Solimonas fluminis]